MIWSSPYKPGDPVVYRVTKHSPRPGRRAQDISPATNGDNYVYNVEKYRVVEEVLPDGHLKLRTRKGKIYTVPANDPNLRRPWFWESWLKRTLFPAVDTESRVSLNDVSGG